MLFIELPAAQASPNDGIFGAYVRAELGISRFAVAGPATLCSADDRGRAGELWR